MKKKIYLSMICFVAIFLFTLGGWQLHAQTVWNGTTDTTWYDGGMATDFYISTAEELAGLAEIVNNQTATFAGKTIHLTADIWLNANGSTANNWTPIGGVNAAEGATSVNNMGHFAGTFNGNEHTIYNLYCSQTSLRAGLFGQIRFKAKISDLVLMRPTIASTADVAGALVATIAGGTNPAGANSTEARIERCQLIGISVAGANNTGGMVGSSIVQSTFIASVTVKNCAVAGTVTSSGSNAGGIFGTVCKTDFQNCYFAGTITAPNATNVAGIYADYASPFGTATNCFSNITRVGIRGNTGTAKTLSEMQAAGFVTTLNGTDYAFKADCTSPINNGYPIMQWTICGVPIAGETNICADIETTLTASGWSSYQWSTGETGETITVSPDTTTTYYVTGTTGPASAIDSITLNVATSVQINAAIATSADGQQHGTVTPATYSQSCANTVPIDLTINADNGYYISEIVINGETAATFTPGEATTNYIYSIENPQQTCTWNVTVRMNNEYTITTEIVMDDEDETPVTQTGLVTPNNGNLTVLSFADTTIYFNNSISHLLSEVIIDDNFYGILDSFRFENITANINIKAIYSDNCAIDTFPYTQSFPNEASISDCWSSAANTSATTIYNSTYNHGGDGGGSISLVPGGGIGSPNYVMAILPKVNMPVSQLKINFWLRPGDLRGTFEVGVITHPDAPETFVSLHTIALENEANWTEYELYLNSYSGEGSYIVFKHSSSIYSVLVDDVMLDLLPDCSMASNLTLAERGYSSALLTWELLTSAPEFFIVEWEETGSGIWESDTIDGTLTEYTLTELSPATGYTANITPLCEDFEGTTASIEFGLPCLAGDMSVEIASVANVYYGDYLPINTYYNTTYSQQIFLANEMANVETMSNIAFQYFDTTSRTKDIEIYVGHTTATHFTSSANYIPLSQLSLAYTLKATTFSNTEEGNWVTLPFDYPFSYDGTSNIVIAVYQRGNHDVNSAKFYTHLASSSDTMTIHFASFGVFDPASPSGNPSIEEGMATFRSNIRIFNCTDDYSCVRPSALAASEITENSALLTWLEEGESSSYLFEYKEASATDWNSEVLTNSSTLLTELPIATRFDVRVAALCDSGDTTAWALYAFSTACEEVNRLPYTENFDLAVEDIDFPICWTGTNNGTTFLPTITRDSEYVTAPACLRFNLQSSSALVIAAMPKITDSLDMNTLQLSFMVKATNAQTGTFIVGIMEDPNNYQTFYPVDTISQNETWASSEISFADYDDWGITGRYVAFMLKNAPNNACFIDNVQLDEISVCPRPTDLVIADLQHNGAEIGWTQTGDVISWSIEYGPSGFTPGNGIHTEITSSNPYTITGLLPLTEYDFYVQAHCGTEDVSTPAMTRFTTLCTPIGTDEIPFLENFDSYADRSLPECWYGESSHATVNTPFIYTGIYLSANNSIYLYATGSTYAYLATPAIDPDINTLMLSFSARISSLTTPIIVGVMSDDHDLSTFTPIDSLYASTADEWKRFDVYFNNVGSANHIAFLINQAAGLYIDSLLIDHRPTCLRPMDLEAIAAAHQTITVAWESHEETAWEVEIGAPGFAPGTGSGAAHSVTTAPPFVIPSLSPSTSYDIYVRAVCGTDSYSDWSYKTTASTAIAPCFTPSPLIVDDIAHNSATATWTVGYLETAWIVEYKEMGDETYHSETVTVPTYTFLDLSPETQYEICVKADCGYQQSEAICEIFTTLSEPSIFHTVTATAGENGSIDPEGAHEVPEGGSITFTFTADDGYQVAGVTVSGQSVGFGLTSYTISNVLGDSTIHVNFEIKEGVDGYGLDNNVTIFPNPAEHTLHIKLDIPFEKVEILNMLGQIIQTETINDLNASIDISRYNAGVYFIKLSGSQGTVTKKFVKS